MRHPIAVASLSVLPLVVGAPLHGQSAIRETARPSIVLIVMDDLGYGDLGSYGVPDAKTPNIDRLAREGVRFTDFYSNGANCSPTRTGFITGRYQQRYGIEWPLGSVPGDSARGVPPSEGSLPRLLKSAGYRTALIGKWHLGWNPEFGPRRHGFDEFWGFLGGFVDYYNNMGEFSRHDLFHNEEPAHDSAYLTDRITARAQEFIETHASAPFFIEVAYNATHWPFQGPALAAQQRARPDMVRDGTRAEYVAMLESADLGVGKILRTLDSLRLTRNTLVIFTSDNGGEWLSRNAPFFHRKSTLWEGGIRVPALIRWPARLRAGAVTKQVGITMDLTASIVAAAGVVPPASYRPEGIDLMPLIEGGRVMDRTLFWRIAGPARNQRAVRRGRWKYLRDGGHEFLFDLETDVGERRDLSVDRRAMVAELRTLVAAWEAAVDSGRPAVRR
jgi:arylsulfatase A-like enzyme